MSRLIVYHNADWDGVFSAAIVHMNYPDADLYGYNRGKVNIDLDGYDEIYVVDIDLPEEYMRQYADKIIWIDHHLTSYYKYMDVKFKDSLIDVTGSVSAAYLAWQKMNGINAAVPECIKYVSEYDVHNFVHPKVDVMKFQSYLRVLNLSVDSAMYVLNMGEILFDQFMAIGSSIMTLKTAEETRMMTNHSWTVNLDGNVGFAVLTSNMTSLDVENTLNDNPESFIIMMNRLDESRLKVSIRCGANSAFDARVWCEKHKGGGHPKAAGCNINVDEFMQLYTQGKL